MASTAAGYQSIIDAIDDLVLAKMQGQDCTRYKLGDEEVWKYTIAELRLLRKEYQLILDGINAGTEYWDVFHDGVDTLTGRDLTVSIGDIED